MARAKKTLNGNGRSGAQKAKGAVNRRAQTPDAIALLKADHREVATWFEQFAKSRSVERKATLAKKICGALKIHSTVEEEIFYPVFLQATKDKALHHEAEVEHDSARKLITDIEASGPADDFFEAKVKVLSEMIKHHVKEEEQPGGMFAEARDSTMDLKALGEKIQARKHQLSAVIP